MELVVKGQQSTDKGHPDGYQYHYRHHHVKPLGIVQ